MLTHTQGSEDDEQKRKQLAGPKGGILPWALCNTEAGRQKNQQAEQTKLCIATRSVATRGDSRVGRGATSVPWGGNPLGQHSGRKRELLASKSLLGKKPRGLYSRRATGRKLAADEKRFVSAAEDKF